MSGLNPNLKAIDTRYKGRLFRSRLEARWAVYFDVLKWNWLYEHEGYELPSSRYLPDFYFPDIVAFGEVKPFGLTPQERLKCIELSMENPDVPILLLVGNPDYCHIQTIRNGGKCLDVVPVPKWSKYYPMFFETINQDKNGISHFKQYHDETALAVDVANEMRFEFDYVSPRINL